MSNEQQYFRIYSLKKVTSEAYGHNEVLVVLMCVILNLNIVSALM